MFHNDCISISIKSSNRQARSSATTVNEVYKIQNDKCVKQCDSGYMLWDERKTSKAAPGLPGQCIPCLGNTPGGCPKDCSPDDGETFEIKDIQMASSLKGCTRLQGSLFIHLRGIIGELGQCPSSIFCRFSDVTHFSILIPAVTFKFKYKLHIHLTLR